MKVPATKTPMDPTAAEEHLADAWDQTQARPVTPGILRLLLALWDFETGTGGSQYQWNYGNIVATSDNQDWYNNPGLPAGPGAPRFRAYSGPAEGAQALVRQLTSPTRPQWHAGLLTEDPDSFVAHLKGEHGGPQYFEAPLNVYQERFRGRWTRYAHLEARPSAPSPLDPIDHVQTPPPGEILPPPKARPSKSGGIWVVAGSIALMVWASRRWN